MACFERSFYADGRPVALIRSKLPERLCPGIVERRLVNDSLTATLEKTYGLVPARVDQWLKAKNVSVEEAGWLEIEAGTAVLEIHTRSVLEDGTQFEDAQTLCVGERLCLHIHFSAGGESSPNQIEYVMPASL
jgi:GntR family transcriptional regulator